LYSRGKPIDLGQGACGNLEGLKPTVTLGGLGIWEELRPLLCLLFSLQKNLDKVGKKDNADVQRAENLVEVEKELAGLEKKIMETRVVVKGKGPP